MGDMPDCCYPSPNASFAERLYCAYNAGGERPGLNYQDKPCPLWRDLPPDVRAKWEATAKVTKQQLAEAFEPLRDYLHTKSSPDHCADCSRELLMLVSFLDRAAEALCIRSFGAEITSRLC